MKNSIGAMIILFVVYLHFLVVPPRNLRGQYYKGRPGRRNDTCDVEYYCATDDIDVCDKSKLVEVGTEENRCWGVCLTQTVTEVVGDKLLFRGQRCIEFCEDYCSELVEGYMSCFNCE